MKKKQKLPNLAKVAGSNARIADKLAQKNPLQMENQVEQQPIFFQGNEVTLKPHVEFENMTAGKPYKILEIKENEDGVWYLVLNDAGETQVLFADQIEACR